MTVEVAGVDKRSAHQLRCQTLTAARRAESDSIDSRLVRPGLEQLDVPDRLGRWRLVRGPRLQTWGAEPVVELGPVQRPLDARPGKVLQRLLGREPADQRVDVVRPKRSELKHQAAM